MAVFSKVQKAGFSKCRNHQKSYKIPCIVNGQKAKKPMLYPAGEGDPNTPGEWLPPEGWSLQRVKKQEAWNENVLTALRERFEGEHLEIFKDETLVITKKSWEQENQIRFRVRE